jgi:hypothetical protein
MIASPRRERMGGAGPAVDRESKQEDQDLGATVEGRRDQVVPLDEVLGAVLAQVELAEDADGVVAEDGRVDAGDQVAQVPQDDAGVQVAPDALLREEAVHDVEGERGREADEVGDGDPFVARADGEDFGGDGPGDREGVELLEIDAGPDRGTFDGDEVVGLVVDDAV